MDEQDARGDLVVDDGARVVARDVDPKLDDVLGVELERLRLCRLGREAVPVHKRAVGRLDVLDQDLARRRVAAAAAGRR